MYAFYLFMETQNQNTLFAEHMNVRHTSEWLTYTRQIFLKIDMKTLKEIDKIFKKIDQTKQISKL